MRTDETDAVKVRIAALDLEPIKFKLMKEHNYTKIELDTLEKWYRRFLFLTFKYQNRPIVVSEAIDRFWHQHILDTRKYAEDCEAAFGEFLHHFPYFGLRGDDDVRALRTAYRSSLELMREEFGDTPDEELRVLGTNPADTELPSLCSDCGTVWPNQYAPLGQQRPRLTDEAM
jgi:hypothetical protein